MGVGDVKKLFPEGAGFLHHGVPLLGAVGDGNDGNAGAGEILQGLDGVVNGDLREKAGACVEDMDFFLDMTLFN